MGHAEQHGRAAFTAGHVEADGFRIHYAEAGQGRPVVMLHGTGGLILSKVHDELAKKYRVIAFEMPGVGQSPANATSLSVQDLARTMAQAAAQLGLDTYALISTSVGGRVALWQALQAPQQVDLLVLIAPTAVVPEGYTMSVVTHDQLGTLLFAHAKNVAVQPSMDPVTIAKEMALLQRIRGTGRDTELEGKLSEMPTQTLVVFGTADKVVPPEMGHTYREQIPNCHYVLVYDAGHAVAAERPEALTNTIIDFLDLGETFIVRRRDGRVNP